MVQFWKLEYSPSALHSPAIRAEEGETLAARMVYKQRLLSACGWLCPTSAGPGLLVLSWLSRIPRVALLRCWGCALVQVHVWQ